MRRPRFSLLRILRGLLLTILPLQASAQSQLVTIEAESGELGAEVAAITTSIPGYITVTTNSAGSSPGSSARVARYTVTFPAVGTYRLFARVRVGPAGPDDDSFHLGNGFGAKNPATASNWRTVNNFSGSGYANFDDVVAPAGGSTGAGVWKWIDVGALAGLSVFTVPAGALTQILDIGGREDGLHIDKFVFAPDGPSYTVEDLMKGSGTGPSAPTALTLEAEESEYGADFALSIGIPSYLTATTTSTTVPGTSARVMRFTALLATSGQYRLFARVRIGPGGANDDSLYLGAGFGEKDPTLGSDWRAINNLAGVGFSSPSAVVAGTGGSAGIGVWKWIDLSAFAGREFTVGASALTQILDIGGRESGFDIDKIVFAPARNTLTVADLDAGRPGSPPPVATLVTVDARDLRQRIDGFGASSAWTANAISEAQADLFFSPVTGIGLSLLRMRIAPEGTTGEVVTAQRATARGVGVWAAPWSPPAAWKTNNDVSNGGSLLPQFYGDWGVRLADFALSMQQAGVPLIAISAQNEPNYTATWESCRWTPAELASFVRDHLGPALASRGLATRVLAPETVNFDALPSYGSALLSDSATRSFVGQVATHSYGRAPASYPAAAAAGIAYWQTEFTEDALPSDPTIDSGIRTAEAIHDFLTVAEGNAWHYWWLNSYQNGSGGLVEGGALAKRGWALGNWARFARPGHRRLQTLGSGYGALVSAFISPNGRRLTVVAVNADYAAHEIPLAIQGGTAPSLARWETSYGRSLGLLAPIQPASDGSFMLPLPARSITTFVTETFNRPPSAISLEGRSIGENRPAGSLVGLLSAEDPDWDESFTFALVNGEGAEENHAFTISGRELRAAAMLDHESAPARSIRVRATDAGGAFAEQVFLIQVLNDPDEYEDWAAALPPGSRSPTDAPHGDGVPNLLAHALGALPGAPLDPARLPLAHQHGSSTRFSFILPAPAHPRIEYAIERSADLAGWTAVATKQGSAPWTGPAAVQSPPVGDGSEQVSVEVGGEGDRVFYRLRLTLAPPGI
jgi:glucuronoarabinoxylan endo-1,4-beta-xylanase